MKHGLGRALLTIGSIDHVRQLKNGCLALQTDQDLNTGHAEQLLNSQFVQEKGLFIFNKNASPSRFTYVGPLEFGTQILNLLEQWHVNVNDLETNIKNTNLLPETLMIRNHEDDRHIATCMRLIVDMYSDRSQTFKQTSENRIHEDYEEQGHER